MNIFEEFEKSLKATCDNPYWKDFMAQILDDPVEPNEALEPLSRAVKAIQEALEIIVCVKGSCTVTNEYVCDNCEYCEYCAELNEALEIVRSTYKDIDIKHNKGE